MFTDLIVIALAIIGVGMAILFLIRYARKKRQASNVELEFKKREPGDIFDSTH